MLQDLWVQKNKGFEVKVWKNRKAKNYWMLSIEKPNNLMFIKNGLFQEVPERNIEVIFNFQLSGQKFPALVKTL